ncbi:hypothetical protein DAPPUDRAFT_313429 [Daphnia pulex]|uniref:Secreted protein n=1 Tax=Daphnia pulex TaxID=6669 RepID=E9G482_DAPPU|nr:hypothetical protein DAPPUDRAFT_313429 [Daphnia pulex]|eukprot:EFX85709.1 hypothetical protein DAPPUDRAFT_313429 [Daphnia pulex]
MAAFHLLLIAFHLLLIVDGQLNQVDEEPSTVTYFPSDEEIIVFCWCAKFKVQPSGIAPRSSTASCGCWTTSPSKID